MPNKNYLAGRRFEYEVMNAHKKLGWNVLRTAGSHGEFDLVIYGNFSFRPWFVQCKIVETIAEADRLAKKFEKLYPLQEHISPVLAVKVKGTKQPRYYVSGFNQNKFGGGLKNGK